MSQQGRDWFRLFAQAEILVVRSHGFILKFAQRAQYFSSLTLLISLHVASELPHIHD